MKYGDCSFHNSFMVKYHLYPLGGYYNILISLLGFLFCAIEVERTYGTIPFFCDIFIKNLII